MILRKVASATTAVLHRRRFDPVASLLMPLPRELFVILTSTDLKINLHPSVHFWSSFFATCIFSEISLLRNAPDAFSRRSLVALITEVVDADSAAKDEVLGAVGVINTRDAGKRQDTAIGGKDTLVTGVVNVLGDAELRCLVQNKGGWSSRNLN